jgi:hypothetical protein
VAKDSFATTVAYTEEILPHHGLRPRLHSYAAAAAEQFNRASPRLFCQ